LVIPVGEICWNFIHIWKLQMSNTKYQTNPKDPNSIINIDRTAKF
jgi:hypothetical protein